MFKNLEDEVNALGSDENTTPIDPTQSNEINLSAGSHNKKMVGNRILNIYELKSWVSNFIQTKEELGLV